MLFRMKQQKKKKESVVDLSKLIDKKIRVKFMGGREGKFLFLKSLSQTILFY